ncbi:hypothetical protein B0A55_11097, partial [Friedmanniomyces simplex]
MPITADQERRLLNHYKLTSLYPDTWPHQNDGDDDDTSDEEDTPIHSGGPVQKHPSPLPGGLAAGGKPRDRNSSSRYRNIDRHASIRSAGSIIGSESVVQHDEPDPLGMTPSVAAELRKRGLPVEEDLKLRNRFMLSSTSFSPALFLSQVHQEASTEDLLRGLDFLSRSIEQKSASLKVLVESNFEKFVRAKATIDNVYTEMRTQGATDADSPSSPGIASPGRNRPHSRHTSRGQSTSHFRNTSGTPFSPSLNSPATTRTTTARKNALTRESEYGVLGIKAPLQDVAIKAEELWGPALGGRDKEENLKQVMGTLDQYKEVFGLGSIVAEAIRKNDYDTVIEGLKKANKHADQARQIGEQTQRSNTPLSDRDAQMILLIAHAYHDITIQLEAFKRVLWRRLKTSHGRKPGSIAVADELSAQERDEHMVLMAVLLQLGVDENPIWEWLSSRGVYLKDRIARGFERARIEVEILRRRLAGAGGSNTRDSKALVRYLRAASASGGLGAGKDSGKEMDTPSIVAFWEKVLHSMRLLLGSAAGRGGGRGGGIVGEVVEFWEVTQGFIDGRGQRAFPAAVFATGNPEHLELEPDDVANLRSGAIDLITQLRDSILSFFVDAPVDDLSELY